MLDISRTDLVIGIIGAGVMGRGIAQLCAAADIETRVLDAMPGAAEKACKTISDTFSMLASKNRMSADKAAAASKRLSVAASEKELAGCHIVIEAIIEEIGVKRKLIATLDEVLDPNCLIASNTSSLSVTSIAAGSKYPGRIGGFHFFNPAPLMKVVEVVSGTLTEPWVADALTALAIRIGHRPARAADTPGFIVNHAGRGFTTEALQILQEGVATIADIDPVMKEVAGFRMGPFELLDLTGVDVSFPVMESIYQQFYEEARFRPSYLLRQRRDAGLYGKKVGRGFYAYKDGQMVNGGEQAAPASSGAKRPVKIGPVGDPAFTDMLTKLVSDAGWQIVQGNDANALILIAPLGEDATTIVTENGLDAARTVAVDCLLGLEKRRTLMLNPATKAEFAASAQALLEAGGHKCVVINDSPGFIAQRILALIVNIGCGIAQAQIATPEDIDAAVKLGLNYPNGPVGWGDILGPKRVLAILNALQKGTGDQRYRPSPWLVRRAKLGLSLLHPERA